jgi:hypothetical protein
MHPVAFYPLVNHSLRHCGKAGSMLQFAFNGFVWEPLDAKTDLIHEILIVAEI